MYDFILVQVHMILATGVAAVARSAVRLHHQRLKIPIGSFSGEKWRIMLANCCYSHKNEVKD